MMNCNVIVVLFLFETFSAWNDGVACSMSKYYHSLFKGVFIESSPFIIQEKSCSHDIYVGEHWMVAWKIPKLLTKPFQNDFFQKEHFLNGTGSDSLFQLPLNFLSKKHFGTRIPKKLSKLLDLGYIPLHICFFHNTPCM